MRHGEPHAVDEFADWLVENLPTPDDKGLLANAMAELIDGDATVLQVQDAASRLGVSTRTLQRLARRYVGLPPAAMIRRRRLQEAADRLRSDPDTDIAAVAADLGYTDHAHLAGDFRAALGFTPSAYRMHPHLVAPRVGAVDTSLSPLLRSKLTDGLPGRTTRTASRLINPLSAGHQREIRRLNTSARDPNDVVVQLHRLV